MNLVERGWAQLDSSPEGQLVGIAGVVVACSSTMALNAELPDYVDRVEELGFGLSVCSRSEPVRKVLWHLALAHGVVLLPLGGRGQSGQSGQAFCPTPWLSSREKVLPGLSLHKQSVDAGDMGFRLDRARLAAKRTTARHFCTVVGLFP